MEKRIYSSGYYFEKSGKRNLSNQIAFPDKSLNRKVALVTIRKTEIDSFHCQENFGEKLIVKKSLILEKEKSCEKTFKILPHHSEQYKIDDAKPTENKKPNRMATMSFGISILALVGLIISFAFAWPTFIIFFLLAIPAFIFGLIGLKQIKSNPDLYNYKWFAWVGIAIGGLEILAFLLVVIEFILFLFFI